MGRRKSYDRDLVVQQAMELFWQHGFQGTSSRMLSAEIGINPFSLSSEFGSKQGLFEAALAQYLEDVTRIFAPLSSPDACLEDIRQLFSSYASFARTPAGKRGCFLTNVAAEASPSDITQPVVDSYVRVISSGFDNCLRLAKKQGELRQDVIVLDEARFFLATVLGFFVIMRSNTQPALLKGAINAANRHLDSLMS